MRSIARALAPQYQRRRVRAALRRRAVDLVIGLLLNHRERRNAQAAARRRLAELEQQQLDAAARRPDRKAARMGGPTVPKVTEAELARRREERLRLPREAEAARKRQARTADEEEYGRVVLVANTNRDDSVIEARSVEAADPGIPRYRRMATPSAASRSRTRHLKKQRMQGSKKRNLV
ncbi:unnamed protein product [Urochloa humidicola]